VITLAIRSRVSLTGNSRVTVVSRKFPSGMVTVTGGVRMKEVASWSEFSRVVFRRTLSATPETPTVTTSPPLIDPPPIWTVAIFPQES
jgi:hypothetical protein